MCSSDLLPNEFCHGITGNAMPIIEFFDSVCYLKTRFCYACLLWQNTCSQFSGMPITNLMTDFCLHDMYF